jgi:hypothetical protein
MVRSRGQQLQGCRATPSLRVEEEYQLVSQIESVELFGGKLFVPLLGYGRPGRLLPVACGKKESDDYLLLWSFCGVDEWVIGPLVRESYGRE